MLVGEIRKLIQPSARKFAELMQVWLKMRPQRRVHIQRQEIAQASIDPVEVEPAAIRGDVLGPACGGGRSGKSGGIGDGGGCDVVHADRVLRLFRLLKRFVSRLD